MSDLEIFNHPDSIQKVEQSWNYMPDIRFGVGNPQEVRSSTWCLSIGTGQAYLTRRFKTEKIKFSLHSSGIWRFAPVSKTPRPAFYTWTRPKPVLDSWVLGPTIIFSPFKTIAPIKPEENYSKKIKWLAPAMDGFVRIAMVAFSKNEISADNYLRQRLPVADWISSLAIKDDGKVPFDKVWVFSWIESLQEFTKKQILDFTNGIKIHHKGTGESITSLFYPLLLPTIEEEQKGLSPTFIDIIPGKNNLERDN